MHPRFFLLTRTDIAQSKRLWRLSPTRTPNAHITFVYLLKPTSDALIKFLAMKATSRLRDHLPRTHPCRLVTPKTIKNDATNHFSSLFYLPSGRFCQRAQHLTSGYRKGSNTAPLMVLTNQRSANTSRQACRGPLRRARQRSSPFHSVSTHFTIRNSILDRVYHGLQGE